MFKVKSTLLILSYIFFVIFIWYLISSSLSDKVMVRDIVVKGGIFAPLFFILIQIAQNIFAPIAHYPILLAGGYIFGPIVGFFYNWIGTVIGTVLIIILTRKYGRPLINRMISKSFIEKYDLIVQKLSPVGLFLIYALPIFPDDEITYLIGVSAMPVKSIAFAVIFGKIPGASLSFMGDEVVRGIPYTAIIQIAVVIIGLLVYFRKYIFSFLKRKKE